MSSVFWLLSVLSAGYFLIYAASIGVNNLFLFVYPVLALLFALMGILSRKFERGSLQEAFWQRLSSSVSSGSSSSGSCGMRRKSRRRARITVSCWERG